ncbi:MAG: LD-carboxypeptidase, partial [Anaerolineae bacterium]|nr:LD-carboxypeptidase [Anaerolineae bacterium]
MKPDLIKPPKLQPGDRVATVSLSWGGPGEIPHRYNAGKRQLEAEFGVTVVEMPHTLADPEWIADNPRARAEDLMQAFADPTIRAIISTIGGDDSIRILPFLDLDMIRANPKIVMGYSDTTVTLLACLKAGLVSFYGPAIMSGFAENAGMFPYMVESVRRTLFSSEPVGAIAPNLDGWTVEHLDWADPENQARKRTLNP